MVSGGDVRLFGCRVHVIDFCEAEAEHVVKVEDMFSGVNSCELELRGSVRV